MVNVFGGSTHLYFEALLSFWGNRHICLINVVLHLCTCLYVLVTDGAALNQFYWHFKFGKLPSLIFEHFFELFARLNDAPLDQVY